VGFVYSDIVRIDKSGEYMGGHYIDQPGSDRVLSSCELYRMMAETGNPVACPTVMVRKECYEGLGLFDTRFPFAADMEMWLRMAARYDVGFLARPLVAHRVHDGQEGARFRGTGRDYLDVVRVLDRTFSRDLPGRCARFRREMYLTLCRQAIPMARWKFRSGQIGPALRYTYIALKSLLTAGRTKGI
jgi:hypothetical protein